MKPAWCTPHKNPSSMTTLHKLVVSLILVLTMDTLYAKPTAFGENNLKILHNGAGSLTVKLDDEWASNHQSYDGRGRVTATGVKGDAGVCVAGVNPLDRQEDWTTSCTFTATPNVDRSFNAMLTIGRSNEAAFDAETFHYIGLHCYLDKDGYPQGWIHTQESTEPVPTMSFEPEVRAAYNGKDSFAFEFSAANQNPVSPQILTVIFSNGSAESRCVLDAKTIRPSPYRPWFIAYGTPNLFYCGPPRWTIHSVNYDAVPHVPEPTILADAPAIVPAPKEIHWTQPAAWFTLDHEVAVDAGTQTESPAADSLRRQIMGRCGVALNGRGDRTIAVGERGKGNARLDQFCLEENVSPPANREGYTLVVQPDFIAVVGSSPAGAYYGVQTLAQMAVESSDAGWRIPCGSVTDWPDFPFRGAYIQ
ncbi:MAG: glycoside hydrolase family 20 zincin-like fold domain-containing protein, partial [Candidatus Poribacteria bacterium]|nr:glycoside hydrolase family 20 zincin-like fold domain-containing protein [Candidatus Poribacteria bacterium]